MIQTLSFKLHQTEIGPMKNYIYIIVDKETSKAIVIDPAWDVPQIKEILDKEGYHLEGIFITHGHPDHTNGITKLLNTKDVPVYVSEHEASFYKPIHDNIKGIKPSAVITLGKTDIQCLHTPGHTPGSQCFLVQNHLISGDTLFLDGCGRCDLPGGNAEQMYHTLYNILMKLPPQTIIFPGHNYHHKKKDSLSEQKKTNPYLNCSSLHNFIQKRMY